MGDSWKNLGQNPVSSCFTLILTDHRTHIQDPEKFFPISFKDNTNSDIESGYNLFILRDMKICADP